MGSSHNSVLYKCLITLTLTLTLTLTMTDGRLNYLVQYKPSAKLQQGHRQTAKSTKSSFFVVFADVWLIIPPNSRSKMCWSPNWPLPVSRCTKQHLQFITTYTLLWT